MLEQKGSYFPGSTPNKAVILERLYIVLYSYWVGTSYLGVCVKTKSCFSPRKLLLYMWLMSVLLSLKLIVELFKNSYFKEIIFTVITTLPTEAVVGQGLSKSRVD